MKTFYEITTHQDKQEDGTFKTRYVVHTPTGLSSQSFYSLYNAREFIRIDQIPTPPPTTERIPAKLTPEQKLSIREQRKLNKLINEENEKSRARYLKNIERQKFYNECIILAVVTFTVASIVFFIFF